MGGVNVDIAKSVALNASGDLYVVEVTSSFGTGGYDAFIAKFDPSGSLLWDRAFGGTGTDDATDVVLGPGCAYVVGVANSFGTIPYDVFLVKFSSDGSITWARTWGRAAMD